MMVFPFLVGNLYILVEIQSGLNYKNVVHSRARTTTDWGLSCDLVVKPEPGGQLTGTEHSVQSNQGMGA